MSRSKIFEKFPVALMSGSEIFGCVYENLGRVHVAVYNFCIFYGCTHERLCAFIRRSTIFENFTAALMSGSEIFLTAQGRISGAHERGLAAHGRVSGARGRG